MAKTVRLTGWSGRTELRDGLRRTYDWYRLRIFDGPAVDVR
jgi:nucleoside-diphosphate-sugar epimerase